MMIALGDGTTVAMRPNGKSEFAALIGKLLEHRIPVTTIGGVEVIQTLVDEQFACLFRPRRSHTMYRKRIKRTDKTRRRKP
jgi:hypothetical protein